MIQGEPCQCFKLAKAWTKIGQLRQEHLLVQLELETLGDLRASRSFRYYCQHFLQYKCLYMHCYGSDYCKDRYAELHAYGGKNSFRQRAFCRSMTSSSFNLAQGPLHHMWPTKHRRLCYARHTCHTTLSLLPCLMPACLSFWITSWTRAQLRDG